jgi:hypothetical protein
MSSARRTLQGELTAAEMALLLETVNACGEE